MIWYSTHSLERDRDLERDRYNSDRRIRKVCVAVRDPDPRNNGRGIAMLKTAGIAVVEGVLDDEILEFVGPFLYQG